MASEEKLEVKISATTEEFNQGMQETLAQFKNSINGLNKMFADLSKNISASINQAAGNVRQGAENISSSANIIKTAMGTVGIGIVGAFGKAAKSTIEYEKSLLSLSRTAGLTVESAGRLAYASGQCGMTAEDLSRNIGILSRNLAVLQKDSDNTANVFNRYRITVEDLSGKLLPTNQILMNVADRFKSMPNGVEKTALAMQIFGRSGQQMIPMLNQGSEGIQKMGDTAEKLGLVLKDTSAFAAYSRAQKEWTSTLKGIEIQMGSAVLPILTAFSRAITNALQAFNSLDAGLRQAIVGAAGVTGAVAAMTFGWGAAAAALTAFGGPFARVGTMMAGTPNVIAATVGCMKSMIVGLTDATIATIKYVATGGIFTTASKAMGAASAAVSTAMHGVRTAVLATTLAYNTGGISSIVKYCASLVSMNTIVAAARGGLMLLYGTVTGGIAVVAALGIAWMTNFGDIQKATAGVCDGISYGLNNFANGVKRWASGIADVFSSLAKAISRAFVGDFQGAWDATKGMKDGFNEMLKGMGEGWRGVGQAAHAAITDPGAAWNYLKAGGGALWAGTKNLMGFGSVGGAGQGQDFATDFEAGPAGSDESVYEKAKIKFETESAKQRAEATLAGEKYTFEQRLALYLKYLSGVQKSDKEFADYQKGLSELTVDDYKEASELKRAQLDKEIAENKLTRKNQFESEIAILEEEVTLTLRGSKERVEAETRVINKKREYADYLAQMAQKERELNAQIATDALSIQEKKYQSMYDMGLIGQAQLLALQGSLEGERYRIELDGLEKSLEANAIHIEKQKELYKDYLNAKTDAERDALRQLLADNSKNADDLMALLGSLQAAWTQYGKSRMDLSNKLRQEELKNVTEIKNSMTSAISQGLQDIITKTRSFSQAIRNIITSAFNTLMKQITDTIAKSAVDKAFKKILDNIKGAEVAAEQTAQNKKTAFNIQGNNERLANDMVASQEKIALTQTKTNTEITLETTKDAVVTASAQTAGQAAVASLKATMQSMLAMIPMMLLMGAISGLFGGGGSKTSTSTSSVNLGRNPDSYYQTPNYLKLPSFDVGSWRVPRDMMALIHQDEVIVPTGGGMADNFRAMLSGAGRRGDSDEGGRQVIFSPNIKIDASAIDGRGMKQALKSSSKDLVKILNEEWRNGNRPKSLR